MLRYESEPTTQKWTRTELRWVAGGVVLLLCIWGAISWKNYRGDETQHQLTQTTAELAEAKGKVVTLTSNLADLQKQLDDANSKIAALTSVAARAPQMPVYIREWQDSAVTYAVALQNRGDQDMAVHLSVSNPEFSRTREQDCSIPAHKTINTPIRIYPHDTAIVTAYGFATRTRKMDSGEENADQPSP